MRFINLIFLMKYFLRWDMQYAMNGVDDIAHVNISEFLNVTAGFLRPV